MKLHADAVVADADTDTDSKYRYRQLYTAKLHSTDSCRYKLYRYIVQLIDSRYTDSHRYR